MSATCAPHRASSWLSRIVAWLPRSQATGIVDKWLAKKITELEADETLRDPKTWHPVIQEFHRFIEEDPVIYMGFHEMFEQSSRKPPYNKDPTAKCQVSSWFFVQCMRTEVIDSKLHVDAGAFQQGYPSGSQF